MSSWRQTTKHVVCPAAAHLPIHAPPVPKAATKPICVSITPLFSSGNSTNGIFLFLFVCLSVCLPVLPLVCKLHPFQTFIDSFFLPSFLPFFLSFLLYCCPPPSHPPSARYRECNSFTNFSCLWQLITHKELPVLPLQTCWSAVFFFFVADDQT